MATLDSIRVVNLTFWDLLFSLERATMGHQKLHYALYVTILLWEAWVIFNG